MFIAGVVIGGIVFGWAGLVAGGELALRRMARAELRSNRRRAGLPGGR